MQIQEIKLDLSKTDSIWVGYEKITLGLGFYRPLEIYDCSGLKVPKKKYIYI